jgi:hypothetical protein
MQKVSFCTTAVSHHGLAPVTDLLDEIVSSLESFDEQSSIEIEIVIKSNGMSFIDDHSVRFFFSAKTKKELLRHLRFIIIECTGGHLTKMVESLIFVNANEVTFKNVQ